MLALEKRFLAEAFPALTLCAMGEIAAGAFMEAGAPLLLSVAGLMTLLPPAMGMRGNVFGSFVSKLSTRLHLGTVEPSFRSRTLTRLALITQWEVSFLSLVLPLLIVAYLMNPALLLQLTFIAVFGGVISGAATLFVAVTITVAAYRKGVNPDNVASPAVTTAADFITAPVYMGLAYLSLSMGPDAMLLLIGLAMVVLLAGTVRAAKLPEMRESIRERVPVLLLSAAISTVAGLQIEGALAELSVVPLLIAIVPVINGQGGNMASILASRLTTSYYLGYGEFGSISGRFREFLNALTVGGMVYAVILGMVFMWSGGVVQYALLFLFLLLCTTAGGWILSHYITLASIKLRVDPDNVVIPLLSGIMDLVGVVALVTGAHLVFGV